MTASTPQSNKPEAKALARQLRWHRWSALFFLALGGVLLAANLNLLPPAAQRVVGWGWPALVLVAGAWLLLAGGRGGASSEPTFTLDRADYTAGELVVSTGQADLQVQGLPNADHLAAGQLPAPSGPALKADAGRVQLRMTSRLAVPLLPSPPWSLGLAPDLPWALQVQSSLGDLGLDLRALTLSKVYLRSTFGHVDLTLPVLGQAELEVRLGLGDLTVHVPESMAVKIKVTRGRLATLRPEARRFVELAPGEWATPLFAISPARCTLVVHLWSGELTIL